MTRISIIVPIYNAQDYLGECLDSVAAQTYDNYEVVCVDDGSTDASRDIVATRALVDARIHLVEKPNGGPSSARNAGIDAASGDCVLFLDADDALAPHALRTIAEAFDGRAEAAVFGWSCFGGAPDRWTAQQGNVRDAFYFSFKPELLLSEHVQPFLRVAVNRDALERTGARYDESLRVGEDAAFLFALFPRLHGVRLLSDKLYRYRLPHEGSIMHAAAGDDIGECVNCLNATISVFGDWARDGLVKRHGGTLLCWSVKYALYTMLRQESDARRMLAGTLGDLWRAHWTDDEIAAFDIAPHVKLLAKHALDVDAPNLARDLAAYRIAEYGAADLAATAFERIAPR